MTLSASLEVSIHEGGCHCGAVRFRVRARSCTVYDCNCSICRKKGFLHLVFSPEDFELVRGGEMLETCSFGTHVARRRFCRRCGIHSFYTPRSHPDQVDVNVRCLDGDALLDFAIEPFDGRNREASVDRIR